MARTPGSTTRRSPSPSMRPRSSAMLSPNLPAFPSRASRSMRTPRRVLKATRIPRRNWLGLRVGLRPGARRRCPEAARSDARLRRRRTGLERLHRRRQRDVPTATVPTSPATPAADGLWVREVLKSGYLPFTDDSSVNPSFSAEIGCYNDAVNYDNYDSIDNPVAGGTYYCVAWNVQVRHVTIKKVVTNVDKRHDELPHQAGRAGQLDRLNR